MGAVLSDNKNFSFSFQKRSVESWLLLSNSVCERLIQVSFHVTVDLAQTINWVLHYFEAQICTILSVRLFQIFG